MFWHQFVVSEIEQFRFGLAENDFFFFCYRFNSSGNGNLSIGELKFMMEKLGAPQTHLGLKAMIKVNKEQKSICFSFLVKSSFGDQVHFQIFWTTKNNVYSRKTVLKMWENKGDNLPR